MNCFKLIDAYLDGELTGSELSAFTRELEHNPELASEVELHKDVNKFLYKKADELKKREDLNRMHEEFMKSRSEKENNQKVSSLKHAKKQKKIFYYIAAAASVVIFVGLFFILKQSSYTNQKLFTAYYKPYEVSTTTRGGRIDTVDSHTLYNKAITEYEALQFSKAAKYFEQFVQTDSTNYEAYFLLGISYIETDNIKGAIQSFLRIINSEESLYEDNARWYLGLCYLKNDEVQKASEQFCFLVNTKAFCSIQASEILEKLKK
jgi:TolA-binding protein